MSLTIPAHENRKLSTSNPLQFFSRLYTYKPIRGERTLLHNISFEMFEGDVICIMGDNGAGKTTLMRVLAGIYKPTGGVVDISGGTYGMFDTKMGMDFRATGMENIYLRGLQMGKTFSEIKKIIPEMLDFMDIGDAIYDSVNTYSSGMRGRLTAALSALIAPDVAILLLDEWVGGGDTAFREKMATRMQDFVDKSRGIVIATHSMDIVKKLGCTKGMVLKGGSIDFFGDIESAVKIRGESARQTELEAKHQAAVA
ncbi:MAG: ABC transporter ATP-binding protein [Hyphomonadaceae bacterium]|nr:ABC transporter ATP-binding protein [Hyphomonadaceae bacterium]MBC6412927.1 ABC transporter ATP-binding protein [Hyphomonadaceae bacterium]